MDETERNAGVRGKDEVTHRNQDRHWSRHADEYDSLFLDPYRPDVINPLWYALESIPDPAGKTAADLGCGTGPLIPSLVSRFGRVYALDFAEGMLRRARERLSPRDADRVDFIQGPMHELGDRIGGVDVAVAVNSLVMPDVRVIDQTLAAIRSRLGADGLFLGILPSMDAIHYHTMLLYDQALDHGLAPREAEQVAAYHAEHRYYEFAFGRFKFQGLRQKFWQPFEIEHRMSRAGFSRVRLEKVLYPWDESLAGSAELAHYPRSWDWFFEARP